MIIIKKYSNRRLYDTSSSSYVNLQQIADRIRQGQRIKVIDAKEGEDLTQQVLLQVLLEQQGSIDLLPVGLLHRIIRSTNDHPLQRIAMKQLSAGMQMLDQQLATFERQAGWTADEPPPPEGAPRSHAPPPATAPPPEAPDEADGMDALRARLAALEARLSD